MFRYTAPQLHSFVPPLHLCRSLNTFLSRKAESYARSFRPLLALSSVRARRQAHRRQREAANIEGATAKGWREGEREGGRKEGLANHRRRRRWLLMLEASYTCGIGGAEKKKKKRKKGRRRRRGRARRPRASEIAELLFFSERGQRECRQLVSWNRRRKREGKKEGEEEEERITSRMKRRFLEDLVTSLF